MHITKIKWRGMTLQVRRMESHEIIDNKTLKCLKGDTQRDPTVAEASHGEPVSMFPGWNFYHVESKFIKELSN